ncbi:MAG: SpoIIIAH-like family protein [Clostridia bacterium]|nr:SpoIIIAH-like family protein [Clostridia bacterium]
MRNEERAAMRAGKTEEQEMSVLELPEAEEKTFRFKSFFAGGENGKKIFNAKNIVIALSVLLIGVAIYVNWSMFGGPDDVGDPSGTPGDVQAGTNDKGDESGTPAGKDDASTADFFAASQIERQRARDEAIEVLQGVVDDAASLDVAKEQALADIAAIAATIETEANIESLIKAKGFEECVAVINGDKANIIVKSEGLQPNQLSQILEIVYLQADILPANVTISEK